MLLLDPGSLAFDFPNEYGYRLLFKSFKDYHDGLAVPSWMEWISYETKYFTKEGLVDLSIYCLERRLEIYGRHRLYDLLAVQYLAEQIQQTRVIVDELKRITRLGNSEEKIGRLRELDKAIRENRLEGFATKRAFQNFVRKAKAALSLPREGRD